MAESTQPKTRFGGTVVLTPGSGSAYTVAIEKGNVQISGLTAEQREKILVEDRGLFSTLVKGKQKYVNLSFTAYLRDLVDNTDTTLVGVALQRGAYSSAQSTLGANRPYCVDFQWTMDGTSVGDAANHVFTAEDWSIDDVSFNEDDLNEVTLTGIAYGTISMT
jgi:hypothetical protein